MQTCQAPPRTSAEEASSLKSVFPKLSTGRSVLNRCPWKPSSWKSVICAAACWPNARPTATSTAFNVPFIATSVDSPSWAVAPPDFDAPIVRRKSPEFRRAKTVSRVRHRLTCARRRDVAFSTRVGHPRQRRAIACTCMKQDPSCVRPALHRSLCQLPHLGIEIGLAFEADARQFGHRDDSRSATRTPSGKPPYGWNRSG